MPVPKVSVLERVDCIYKLGAEVALEDGFYHPVTTKERGPAFGIRSTFLNLLTKFNLNPYISYHNRSD